MEKRVLVDPFQKVTDDDFNRFGTFPADSIDHVVNDIGIPDSAYTGMQVTGQQGGHLLNVANGRLITNNGKVYFNDVDGGVEIDIATNLPAVTRRIIAVVTWGQELAAPQESRTFLTDAATRATVARLKSTIELRWAQIDIVVGQEGPDPVRPPIPANTLAVAWVEVDNAGIMSITRELSNVAPSVRSLDTRLNADEEILAFFDTLLGSLRSDLAALRGLLNGLAPMNLVVDLARDVARLNEKAGLPDVYADYGFDPFLDVRDSDTANVDFYAKIEEGIRFPDASIEDDQLGLLNPIDSSVVVAGDFMIPVYDVETRISNVGKDAELPVTNYPVVLFDTVLKYRKRTRIRYGTPFLVCENSLWWNQGAFDPFTNTFTFTDGETFVLTTDGNYDLAHLNAHQVVWRATQFWTDTYDEPYWDLVQLPQSVNGTVFAQTFLNTQEGYLVELGLYFTRRDIYGDVHMYICECREDHTPDNGKVIGYSNLLAGDIKLWPQRTVVRFDPTLLQAGKKYAFVGITGGAQYLALTEGNKYVGGSYFVTTDYGWFQGDTVQDIAFDIAFAKFRSTHTIVQLRNLGLAGGIVGIDLLAETSTPPNTSMTFQVQQSGVWTDIAAGTSLVGLPANLPLRVVLDGTENAMPGIGLLSNSRVRTTRPAALWKHISTVRTPNSPAHTVRVRFSLRGWRGSPHHTFDCKLRTGAGYTTENTAASFIDTPDRDDNTVLVREYVFTFGSAITSYKIECSGTTDNVVACYIVQGRWDTDFV